MHKALIVSALVMLLGACGWHLRGSGEYSLDGAAVMLSADDRYGELARAMQRALGESDASRSGREADFYLQLGREQRSRRAASVGNDALVAEYELTLAVDYRVAAAEQVILPTSRALVTRTYEFDRNAIVAKSEEEELIVEEMRRELVAQILRRLTFVTRNTPTGEAEASGATAQP